MEELIIIIIVLLLHFVGFIEYYLNSVKREVGVDFCVMAGVLQALMVFMDWWGGPFFGLMESPCFAIEERQ